MGLVELFTFSTYNCVVRPIFHGPSLSVHSYMASAMLLPTATLSASILYHGRLQDATPGPPLQWPGDNSWQVVSQETVYPKPESIHTTALNSAVGTLTTLSAESTPAVYTEQHPILVKPQEHTPISMPLQPGMQQTFTGSAADAPNSSPSLDYVIDETPCTMNNLPASSGTHKHNCFFISIFCLSLTCNSNRFFHRFYSTEDLTHCIAVHETAHQCVQIPLRLQSSVIFSNCKMAVLTLPLAVISVIHIFSKHAQASTTQILVSTVLFSAFPKSMLSFLCRSF